jgi:hypothetical protein
LGVERYKIKVGRLLKSGGTPKRMDSGAGSGGTILSGKGVMPSENVISGV